jgi:hypothetical protein
MAGLDIKSKNKADQDKIKKIRKDDGYDKAVGYLSATLVTNKIMPYEEFKEKINYYLKQVVKGQKEAFIKEVYN